MKWFRKAAEQGNTRAQNNLDACYKTGWFADKDDDGKRYEIVMERVTGDVDRLNSFYNKNLRYIDPYRFPEIDDVAGRGKFPQTPLVLFDNLKKSQADLLLNLLGNNYTVRESTTVYPDEITINLGSLFSPAILTFVKVTGLVNRGVAEDFWIATTPVTKSMMAWAKKKLGEDYSESDLKNNDWQGSDYKLFSQCLETFWREQRPLGFRFGILDKSEFEYALKGGQYGSSYKHPGTDSAEEFKKGKTVNALGMGYLNDLHQCWIDEKNDVKGCVYSTQTRQLEEKKSEYWGLIWCGIHVHRGMMKAALKKREEQKKAQKQERKAQQAEQKAQQVVDAAVLRRQKLMEKRKEGK